MGLALLSIVGPVSGGVIAGLLHTVLSPDHLATIITLSACQGTKAFWFGIQWGMGHLGGMAIIGVIFTLLRAGTDFKSYEYYMDYVVGLVLVGMGFHFLCCSEKYFDAEWTPRQATCSCHSHLWHTSTEKDPILPKHCHSHGHGHLHSHDLCHHQEKCCEEATFTHMAKTRRSWGAFLVGFIQGLACPAGVVGIVFLKAYQPMEIAAFLATFFVTATVAMGTVAMLYGFLTERCIRSVTVARCTYFGSCILSIALGVLWLVLNGSGSLESLLGHHHDHGGHDDSMIQGHEGQHGWVDHHHHNLMLAALSLMA